VAGPADRSNGRAAFGLAESAAAGDCGAAGIAARVGASWTADRRAGTESSCRGARSCYRTTSRCPVAVWQCASASRLLRSNPTANRSSAAWGNSTGALCAGNCNSRNRLAVVARWNRDTGRARCSTSGRGAADSDNAAGQHVRLAYARPFGRTGWQRSFPESGRGWSGWVVDSQRADRMVGRAKRRWPTRDYGTPRRRAFVYLVGCARED
jgi:hypothetical protein